MQLYFALSSIWNLVYEGEGGDGGTGDPNPTPPPAPPPAPNNKTYTQAELDGIVAKERRKLQEQNQATIKQLEELKKVKGLTDKEKADLQIKIEELTNASLTKEELAAKEREKIVNQHKTEREQLTADRDRWQQNYTRATIERSIMDEALTAEAYNPRQIVNLLKGQTRLVEKTDSDGRPIPDEFEVKIKMDATDKEGKPITLDLTVSEAIKLMKDKVDEYGNLFKSNLTGGLGGNTGKSEKAFNPKTSTHEEYMKNRAKILS